jgi:hypothetical protein
MEAIASLIPIIFFILACMLCVVGFTFLYYKDFTVKSVGAYVIFLSIITIILLWNPILRGLLHG